MKHIMMVTMLVLMTGMLQGKAVIGPQLQQEMTTMGNAPIEILIVMQEQSDEQSLAGLAVDLPRRARRHVVINELKALSARTQAPVLACLHQATLAGQAEDIVSLWIVNAVACKATPEVIDEISNFSHVEYIESSRIICDNILLTEGTPAPVDVLSRTVEWNVTKVGADSCWALGYKGQGIIVGLIDTGCNYNHYDLRNHMWTDSDYPHHGWNFELNNNDPMDVAGHGTHCSGTIASDGSAGDSCGMAPQCSLMVCRVRTSIAYPHPDTLSETQVLEAMQFVIAPPLSPNHGADVVSMSLGWYFAWTPRRSIWRKSVSNVALAGIAYFIAAGNERTSSYCPVPYNLRCPGDSPGPWHHPAESHELLGGAISIAATDINDALASFSSCGPSCWEYAPWYYDYAWKPGPGLLKPDIAAPGVNITSCAYNNNTGYLSGWSGTSMATPCCAGVAALMLSKNSNLTVAQIDSIMQMTSLDLGVAGKDTMFGAGRVRAKSAIDNTPATGSAIDLRIAEFGTVVLDPIPNGNANDYFDPSERITLVDTLVNLGSLIANNTTGILRTTNSHITINDSMSTYGNISPGTKGNNGADPYIMSADTLINLGTPVPFELALTSGSYTRTLYFQIRMGSIAGPDSVGYFVLDDSDSLYTESPVYNWVDINPAHGGSGTSVGSGANDVTHRARLPFAARHYGTAFSSTDSVSISSNGWISFGRTTTTAKHNSKLPKIRDYGSQPTIPNMIAGYWDSLSTSSPATWWRYHDAANHCFIIQYDSVPVRGTNLRQTFQFIIYDTTLAGPGGHNDIVIQYKSVNGPHNSLTIGQQNYSKTCGVTYLFNDMYDIAAEPLIPGRVIKFTTKQPKMKTWIVGVDEFTEHANMGTRPIVLVPNPANRKVNICYNISAHGPASLKIYNSLGQLVKTCFDEHKNAGVYSMTWEGYDDRGREVPAGVYFYNLKVNGTSQSERGVIIR